MSSEILFAWIYLPQAHEPVVAGRLDVIRYSTGTVGQFTYGKSYLGRADAIPLDPVALPLGTSAVNLVTLNGLPGSILDSCSDKWGIKVIDRIEGTKEYPVGYLLMNDPGRAGALAFSTGAEIKPVELHSREFTLPELLLAAEGVEANRHVDPELLRALHPGTGGARPKCNITDDDGVWIAKFPSINDEGIVSIPRLEHATMQLGQLCGIRTAMTRIENIGGKDVCFVKRFDRIVDNRSGKREVFRKAFLSARTVFYADPAFQSVGTGSYGRLARWMQQRYGCPSGQRHELYRRMVFNVAVRNSDDHELNHGLVHRAKENFELAPAFDIVPVLTRHKVHHHALLIGNSAAGTVENLLSNANAFGLEHDEAGAIIADIESVIENNWRDVFYEAGFGDEDFRKIENIFSPIPQDESISRTGI
jgi:serine/threonine-protein kinase HipA